MSSTNSFRSLFCDSCHYESQSNEDFLQHLLRPTHIAQERLRQMQQAPTLESANAQPLQEERRNTIPNYDDVLLFWMSTHNIPVTAMDELIQVILPLFGVATLANKDLPEELTKMTVDKLREKARGHLLQVAEIPLTVSFFLFLFRC